MVQGAKKDNVVEVGKECPECHNADIVQVEDEQTGELWWECKGKNCFAHWGGFYTL